MAYKIAYRSSFEIDFKKLDSLVQNYIFDIADLIQKEKLKGEKLKGNFKSFYKFPFGHNPEYRMIYKIYKCRTTKKGTLKCLFDDIEHTIEELIHCNGLIEFVLIKSREEMNILYGKSKKFIKKLSR